jgi:hypothetical protein
MKKSNARIFLDDVIFFGCSFEVNHGHHTYLTSFRLPLDFCWYQPEPSGLQQPGSIN